MAASGVAPQPGPSAAHVAAVVAVAIGVGFLGTLGVGLVGWRLPERAPAPAAKIAPPPSPYIAPKSLDIAPIGAIALPAPAPTLEPSPLPVAAPSPTPAPAKYAADALARFTEAANFYRKGAFPQGDAAAAGISDPLMRTALDWAAIRVAATPARLDAFESAHPDWPFADWMRSVREGWRFSAKAASPEAADAKPPLTGEGGVALARAKLALGKRDEAQGIVRSLWRDSDLDAGAETAILREFNAMLTRDDHRARASRLTYAEHGAAAWRAAALAGPDVLALTTARLEAARGPLSARASSSVPLALRQDPGYIFAHVQDARRSGRLDEAQGWLKLAPADPAKLIDPDKWWSERRMVARALIDRGAFDKAYAVAAAGVAATSPAKVDAAFHAGWIALRFLNDPAKAAVHFADAAAAAETPISISRADYWRGRAAEALGDVDASKTFYGQAAAYPIAYYGQLAARKLGSGAVTPRRPASAATGDARAEATRVVELYLETGLDDFVPPIVYAAANVWSDGAQLAGLAEVLNAKGSAALNVVYGKLVTQRGFPLDAIAFPTFGLPDYQALPGSAGMSEVLAVARQESEFLSHAASGAGAKGLMQILPSTAADTARKVGVPFDYGRLLADPAYNMQLGAAYLGELMTAEGGSLPLAAAAYNAGAGRVAQWIGAYGDPRGGADPVDWVERIPFDETRDYVMRVVENEGVYQARLAEPPSARAFGALAGR